MSAPNLYAFAVEITVAIGYNYKDFNEKSVSIEDK